jgi:hypothetical protein
MTKAFEPEIIADLHDLAARFENQFPGGLREYNLYAEEQLAAGHWPGHWVARNKKDETGATLAQAILQELRILVCENDPKYRGVRKSGKDFLKQAIPAIAGYVAAMFGIAIALATSAVAAGALILVRVGTEVFCRVSKKG